MVWSPFQSKNKAELSNAQPSATVLVSWDREGARFRPEPAVDDWLSSPMSFAVSSELVLLLRQLEEEGFAELRGDGASLPRRSVARWVRVYVRRWRNDLQRCRRSQ